MTMMIGSKSLGSNEEDCLNYVSESSKMSKGFSNKRGVQGSPQSCTDLLVERSQSEAKVSLGHLNTDVFVTTGTHAIQNGA